MSKGSSMGYSINCVRIFAGILLLFAHEASCGTRRATGKPAQPVQQAATTGAKKEIFIAGPKQADLRKMTPEDVGVDARSRVETALFELYAKEKLSQRLVQHEKELIAG